ncbi:flagellar assembly protein FliW [Geodermatophilus sabuli]|uniref:Flagellar assembly factor FliW n=1 Tax=Geodermatophilus sabuli TaxID=1564158 RepID=A0A285EIX1_9ACTN|nr:flagellar assembly protein FliW [Geodermatophilus sabuli]MBB3083138.1 flagellar assembly factor FliW [Geodermatophilus sabuli]SNX98134.1 flagellar assembly factor FliW [Geodermatophilus sabuli]
MTLSAVATLPLLSLTEALPGFPGHRDYVLVTADGDGRLFWLQSMAPEGPRFLAVDPGMYFPGYAPVLPPSVRADLALTGSTEARLYCLVTVPPEGPAAATANLRAPIVVNPENWRATQVVLPDSTHPIRRPLRR